MKIMFIKSHEDDKKTPEMVYGCSYSVYPTPDLFTLYNAAVLKSAGHEVSIVKVAKDEPIPQADVYFINSVILSYEMDIELGKRLKNKKVYYFGPYPTLFPEKYLIYKNHFVLRGETEHVVLDAITNPQKAKSISYLKDGKIINNESGGYIKDPDTIPFPARELDENEYYNPKLNLKKFTNVVSSRGCANRCYFCVPNSMSWARELEWKKEHKGKPPVTIRSAENVIAEIKQLKDDGYEEFSFIDDQFVVGKERILAILKGIQPLNMKFGLLARADRINDKDIVKALRDAGCQYVDIGAESFNQKVLDDVHKDIQVKTIVDAVNLLAKYDIDPKLNIMLGTTPIENEKIIEETVRKTMQLPTAYCMFSIATPFPGTEFRGVAEKNDWIIKDEDTNPASVAQISYPHLTNKTLEKLIRSANFRFYFRFRVIKRQLSKIKSPKKLGMFVKLVFNEIRNFF